MLFRPCSRGNEGTLFVVMSTGFFFGDAAAGSVLQVRFQGGETPRARAPPPPPECASSCFQTQLLDSIHPREGTKKWLFIRILVLYCSASHKRGFIM